MDTHLSFATRRSNLEDRILIPKYYDPELKEAIRLASPLFDLPALVEVLAPGKTGSQLGSWLPRENYGTGSIPFVRTSDLFHWRIRPDFKKGVSTEVYGRFRHRIDVAAGDLLMVAHGTYLIGDVALIVESDSPLLLQDHMFRLRPAKGAAASPYLLVAALSTRFVRRQIRARQFSAEIIDKIGERHLGIRVPLPKAPSVRSKVEDLVSQVMALHSEVRLAIRAAGSAERTPGPRASSHYGFSRRRSQLARRILIPRYYDPDLDEELHLLEQADGESWTTIGQLVSDGLLRVSAGVEVGKMAYGTGDIPFIRTSDIVDWELYRDPTQGVGAEVYRRFSPKGELAEDDVVVVRDGTYLVGSSALVLKEDLPALFCGGMLRLRVAKGGALNAHALLGLLNLPAVRRQMRCKQFTRDVIDTLGPRLLEVRIPAPRSALAAKLEGVVVGVMKKKAQIKTLMDAAIDLVEPTAVPPSAAARPGWSMR